MPLTKCMHLTRIVNEWLGPLQIDGHELKIDGHEKVGKFKYQWVIISHDNSEESEIRNRLNIANRGPCACNKILYLKFLSCKKKLDYIKH